MAVERFPVELGHVMTFARAIGDYNPAYFDENDPVAKAAGGVLAPPTFVIADMQFDPESRLRPQPGEPWRGSGREPTPPRPEGTGGGGGMGLHAEQKFEFRRPVRVGDVFTKVVRPGESWEKEGRRGGKMHFHETVSEYYDQSGELVVVATMVGVRVEKNPDA